MTRKRRRLYVVGLAMLALGVATALVLMAFEDNIVFFYTPTDLVEMQLKDCMQELSLIHLKIRL